MGDKGISNDATASCPVMENNEVYNWQTGDFSLHGPEPKASNTCESSQYEDIYKRYPAEVIINWISKGLSTDSMSEETKQALHQKQPKVLILDFNAFSMVPEELFTDSLEVLSIASQTDPKRTSLSRKLILQLVPHTISRAARLKVFRAPINGLSNLPDTFAHLQHLSTIDFGGNSFRQFPKQLLELPSLCELNLSGNRLSELPAEIGKMSKLEILRVANNALERLPEEISQLQQLCHLSLRHNKILQLPRKLHQCRSLKNGTLLVDDNRLAYPPKDICQMGTNHIFEYLQQKEPIRTTGQEDTFETFKDCQNQSNKNLTKLPEDLDLRHFVTLNASNNHLSELPSFPDDLQLEVVLLENNEFITFPLTQLKKLKKLQTLNLSRQFKTGTALMHVPATIYYLQTISELFLCHNEIAVFPEGFFLMKTLTVLDLSDNKLTSIPAKIKRMPQLEVLCLSQNAIEALPDEIGQLGRLKVLSLSTNCLTQIPDSVCELSKLQTLSLLGNSLQRLPLSFTKLSQLASTTEHKITGRTFPSGCILDSNPFIFPAPDIIQQGLAAIFEDLRFWQENPHLMEEQQAEGSHAYIRGQRSAAPTLSDDFLEQLGRSISGRWMDVGRALGLSQDTMAPMCSSANPSLQMLVQWRNTGKTREEAMLGKLAKALEETGLHGAAVEVRDKTSRE